MASISKVVAVCRWWYLFQVVVWLGAHLRLADPDGWVAGWRRSSSAAVGGRGSAVGGRAIELERRTAVGRSAVGRSAVGRSGGWRTGFGSPEVVPFYLSTFHFKT